MKFIHPHHPFQDIDRNRVRSVATQFVAMHRIKYLPCPCGETKTHMHHVDYNFPLHVSFLCSQCHTIEHHKGLEFPLKVVNLCDLVTPEPKKRRRA